MNEGWVAADPTPKKTLLPELQGSFKGLPWRAEIDEVECLVAGMVGSPDCPGNLGVVFGTAIPRSDSTQWSAEALTDFICYPQRLRKPVPEPDGGEGVLNPSHDAPVRINDFLR